MQNDPLSDLVRCILFVLVVSFGLGCIRYGSMSGGGKIVRWELNLIFRLFKWLLGHLALMLSRGLQSLAKQCHGKKKKASP